jgi:hypothetical protein
MNIYMKMSRKIQLLRHDGFNATTDVTEVNAHMHSPYSFSAFDSVRQAAEMAYREGVKVVGINDFNTTDGYASWAEECLRRNLFPLFNIEFVALSRDDQASGIQVNDPNNPGRTYISGKGLSFPLSLKGESLEKLSTIRSVANSYVEQMCLRLNDHLAACASPFSIDFREVTETLTKGNIRERHLAKALRMKVDEHFRDSGSRSAFYERLFGGKSLKSDHRNAAAVENEIRGNLLKAGGPAFVPESPDSFPEVKDVCRIIIDAGGIPTYPFLADDANGNFTGFEKDIEKAVETLKKRKIHSVEFIPSRNTIGILEKYAGYCWNNGMMVTFGTEHNTPLMEPVKVSASGTTELSTLLKEISYMGACIVAAHQYLTGAGEKGYIDNSGELVSNDYSELINLGHALITTVTKK